MKKLWKIIKYIGGEIAFLGFGVLICILFLGAVIGLSLLLYALTTGTWFFDGTNPRFGG